MEADFGNVYVEYRHRIAGYFHSHGLSREDVDDQTMVVFEKALRAFDRYEDRGIPIMHWLLHIAAHTLADFKRRKTLYTWSLDDPELEEETAQPDREPAYVEPLLDELTDDQADVLRLKVYDDRDGEEIAEILGMTYGGVRALQCRGLKRLRQLLDAA